MNSRLRVVSFEFFQHQTRTRFPFRYGIASMTEVPHLFVVARVEIEGSPAVGISSEGLPPKWFTKDPSTTFEQDLEEMFAVIGHAAAAMTSRHAPSEFFRIWKETHDAQLAWAEATHRPALLAELGVSLCERAVLDALCRHLNRPLHDLVLNNELHLDLGALHPELNRARPADLLPHRPADSVVVRHTLGLADPLTAADIPDSERVHDGLPQDLLGSLRAYGLHAFKVKLSGQPDRDLPRLHSLGDLLDRETGGKYLVTLDANENFRDFRDFKEFWRELNADVKLQPLLSRTVVVEQPVHRSSALSEDAGDALRNWPDRPPMIIDESDGAPADLRRALDLGYSGVSHKNCKGIVKGIAHACLLEHRRRTGHVALLTGEDLCILGPVALLQDLAMMAILGIPHVERNGHHYYHGLSPWPEDWQETARTAHPDLYLRDPGGFVRLRVAGGRLALGTVNAAPFGLSPLLDPERFTPRRMAAS